MNRRNVIKGIAAAGTIALLPQLATAVDVHALPVHFVGLGGAGCNVLEHIYQRESIAHFTCITHPVRTGLPADIQFIEFVSPITTHTQPEVAFAIAPQLTAPMQKLLSQNHHYILLAGLGGYTGTKLLQAFTEMLQQNNRPFTIVASLPFLFEKPRRHAVEQMLPSLQALPNFHSLDLAQLSAIEANRKINMKALMQLANEEFYTIYQQCKLKSQLKQLC